MLTGDYRKTSCHWKGWLPFNFAPTQMKNAPNFRVPFDLALCIKISVLCQITTRQSGIFLRAEGI